MVVGVPYMKYLLLFRDIAGLLVATQLALAHKLGLQVHEVSFLEQDIDQLVQGEVVSEDKGFQSAMPTF